MKSSVPKTRGRRFFRRFVLGRGGCALLFATVVLSGRAQIEGSLDRKAVVAGTAASAAAWTGFQQSVQPFLAKYCYDCHGAKRAEEDFRLDGLRDAAALKNGGAILAKTFKQLANHKMPPSDELQPSLAEAAEVVNWLKNYLMGDPAAPINPGRVTLRRLNRTEYDNTIRDLLGVDLHLADRFPVDDAGYGFDNNGDVLALAPMLLEKYLTAAAAAIEQARPMSHFVQPVGTLTKREAVEKNLRSFASRAYRRPVTDEEVSELLRLWAKADSDGRPFQQSLEMVLQAVLVSPAFLFRVESEPQPGEPNGVHTLNDYELATRLAYFLWSSMPDDELFALAEKGTLRAELGAQIRRMLNDAKSSALVENFAGQWLQLRAMQDVAPDADVFPEFDAALRNAMVRETELFFTAIMRQDRSVLEFIDADFTYVNARLAKHYGMTGISGDEFRRVTLADKQRGGLLTQASILTLTSYPRRTSPVLRGKWVLENLFDAAPPPPPPKVPVLPESRTMMRISLKQRMERHRSDPRCAACHEQMDGIGFALENFDAIGRWRTRDGLEKIEASGTLPGGRSVNGAAELKETIKARSDEFVDCLVGRLLTFGLGRGLEPSDRRTTAAIREAVKKNGYRFSALIDEIVRSEPFQKRNGRQNPTDP